MKTFSSDLLASPDFRSHEAHRRRWPWREGFQKLLFSKQFLLWYVDTQEKDKHVDVLTFKKHVIVGSISGPVSPAVLLFAPNVRLKETWLEFWQREREGGWERKKERKERDRRRGKRGVVAMPQWDLLQSHSICLSAERQGRWAMNHPFSCLYSCIPYQTPSFLYAGPALILPPAVKMTDK